MFSGSSRACKSNQARMPIRIQCRQSCSTLSVVAASSPWVLRRRSRKAHVTTHASACGPAGVAAGIGSACGRAPRTCTAGSLLQSRGDGARQGSVRVPRAPGTGPQAKLVSARCRRCAQAQQVSGRVKLRASACQYSSSPNSGSGCGPDDDADGSTKRNPSSVPPAVATKGKVKCTEQGEGAVGASSWSAMFVCVAPRSKHTMPFMSLHEARSSFLLA